MTSPLDLDLGFKRPPGVELDVSPYRAALFVSAAVMFVTAVMTEWPAPEDWLIPRSPYGKAGPIGRAGDATTLCALVIALAAAFSSDRSRVRRLRIAMSMVAAAGIVAAGLMLVLRMLEPNAYDSGGFVVIGLAGGCAAAAACGILLRISKVLQARPSPPD